MTGPRLTLTADEQASLDKIAQERGGHHGKWRNGAIERQNEPLERLNGVLVEEGQDPMRGASVRRYRGGAVGQSKSSAETIEWSATGARSRGFCSAAAHLTDVQSGRLDLLAFIDEHDPMW